MGSKPAVEQFIYDCFRERTEALKRELEIHREYRKRFYHDECIWDSRRDVVEDSEGGKVLEVSPSGIGYDVITTGSRTYCARYRVRPSGGGWLIEDVEIKCGRCQANGADAMCAMCGGTGWQSCRDIPRTKWERGGRGLDRTISPIPDEEMGSLMPLDCAIEQFMADHVRARTAARKREAEIHGAYRERFYSPECRWDSKELTGQWIGDAEKILSVTRAGPEVRVITHGFTPFRLRYHLRPERQTWLIWEVDMECLSCYSDGRRDNCFWCGGTIWEHKEASGGNPDSDP